MRKVSLSRHHGTAQAGRSQARMADRRRKLALPVALGRGGIKANKREGDGATPRGSFRLKRLWWRADRHPRPATALPARRIGPADGWCEDPADRHYNRPVKVPAQSKPTASRAPTGSTTSSSRSTTTPARVSPAAAAPCSSMSRGSVSRRPPAASRSTPPRCAGCWRGSARARASWLSNRYFYASAHVLLRVFGSGWRRLPLLKHSAAAAAK